MRSMTLILLLLLPAIVGTSTIDPLVQIAVALPAPEPIIEIVQKTYVHFDGEDFEYADGILIDKNNVQWKPLKVVTTAYSYRTGIENKKTATQTDARYTYGIASACLPYHTIVRVPHYGTYEVDDTGRIPKEKWNQGIRLLDLRIPLYRYDGVWRSESECDKIAKQHGVQDAIVLIRLQ